MDLGSLREAVTDFIQHIDGTHKHIGRELARLALPDDGQGGSKTERLERCAQQVDDHDLVVTATTILERGDPEPGVRNRLEDIFWEELPPAPVLSLRTRRELARVLNLDDLYLDPDGLHNLLHRLWVLDAPDNAEGQWPFCPSVRHGLEQHVLRNQDWSVEELFDKLGALRATDQRFARFLEGLASAEVLPDEDRQRQFVDILNRQLRPIGVVLQEGALVDGYPTFLLAGRVQSPRAPKQIIFAAIGRKPDLRFTNAIDNEIEIVDGIDRVLVYPHPVGVEGLTWTALQQWWAAEHSELNGNDAKVGLYKRLVRALPESSPPQYEFFAAYHRVFAKAIPRLPMLLPEVWFCWDPKAIKIRGREALIRSRMDFLLLLPGSQRVVIEVDGPHHYVDTDGQPARRTYANDVAGDRGLTLSGYQVYRFSTDELASPEKASNTVETFFRALYLPYGMLDAET